MENTTIENCTDDIVNSLNIGTYIDDGIQVWGKSNQTFKDLKTYDDAYDQKNNRTQSVCIEVTDPVLNDIVTYPMCSASTLEPGYIRLPSDLSTCQTYDCPPGWERDRAYCKKPLIDAIIDKRSKCHERWYDWFVIPNYHLGNNFMQGSNIGTCYAPCKPDYLPNYTTDPVDGGNEFTSGFSNNPNCNRCISKADYLMGKYGITPEFCPLAWIHRINYTTKNGTQDLKNKLSHLYNANNNVIQIDPNSYDPNSIKDTKNNFVSNDPFYYMLEQDNQDNIQIQTFDDSVPGSSNIKSSGNNLITIQNPKNTDVYNKLTSDVGLTNSAGAIINSIGNYLENIPDKFDTASCDACNTLSTSDRLNDAYNVCKNLNDNPDQDDGTPKYQVLKQACNALFCDKLQTNYNSNAKDVITGDSICFLTSQITDQNVATNNDDPNPVRTDSDRRNVKAYIILAILIILAPVVIVILILLFKKVIWPYILKPFLLQILYWLANIGALPTSLLQSFKQAAEDRDKAK